MLTANALMGANVGLARTNAAAAALAVFNAGADAAAVHGAPGQSHSRLGQVTHASAISRASQSSGSLKLDEDTSSESDTGSNSSSNSESESHSGRSSASHASSILPVSESHLKQPSAQDCAENGLARGRTV